ncbi:MAG TPA: DUF1573 domain-containing protein [Gemmatales bacterium]|nr:DUF1573 domain-containing protein [Gemmatales bacterium]
MERILCVCAIFLLLLDTTSAWDDGIKAGTVRPVPEAGKMFGEMKHDFGVVPRGSQLHHRFQWRNTSDKPLELVEYQRSCGCTTVSITPRVVEPGAIGVIDMLMDTKPFAGEKTVNLNLVFGPSKLFSAQYQIKAFSRGDIVYNPGQFQFGVISEGATPTGKLDIEYAGSQDFKITGIAEKPEGLDIPITEAYRRPGAVGYTIAATLGTDVPSGDYKKTIQLRTNDPNNPILPVLVDATIRPSLTVVPDKLFYGTVKAGGMMNRRITLRSTVAFRVLEVEGQGQGISVSVPNSTASVHSLLIQWRPVDVGELKAELRILTDNEKFPVIVLPVSGLAQ